MTPTLTEEEKQSLISGGPKPKQDKYGIRKMNAGDVIMLVSSDLTQKDKANIRAQASNAASSLLGKFITRHIVKEEIRYFVIMRTE